MRNFFQNPPQPYENYYDILNLPYSFDFSNAEEVRALIEAYNDLALYHHYLQPQNEARQEQARTIFKLLDRAYKTLMNTAKRAEYNRENCITAEVTQTAEVPAAVPAAEESAAIAATHEETPSFKSIDIEIDPIDPVKFSAAMNYRRPATGFGGLFGRQEIPDIGTAREGLPRIVGNLDKGMLDERLQQYFLLFNTIKSLEGHSALEPVFKLLKGSFGTTRYDILSYLKTKKRAQGSDLTLSIFSAIFPHIRHDNKDSYDQHFTRGLFAFIDADLLDLGIIRAAYDKKGETLAFRDLIEAIGRIADIQHNPLLRIECKNFFYLRPHRAAALAGLSVVGSYASNVSPLLLTYYLIAILKAPLSVQIIKSVFNNSDLKRVVEDFEKKLSELPQRAVFIHAIVKGASSGNKDAALRIATELMAMSDKEKMRDKTVEFLQKQNTHESKSILRELGNLLDAAYDTVDVQSSPAPRAAAR